MSSARAAAAGATYRLLQRRAPSLYVRVIRWRGADFCPVTRDCQLVIAGAPGSANSWVRAAFLLVNPGLSVGSHAHVWTEVRDAVRHGRPVLLLVRDPLGEAASRLTRFGNVTPARALQDYADYHERVRRWRDDVVIASFDAATRTLGEVIERVNARYGCDFVAFPDGDAATVSHLRSMLAPANGAIPREEGKAEREDARRALLDPSFAELRARCEALYADLCPPAGHSPPAPPL